MNKANIFILTFFCYYPSHASQDNLHIDWASDKLGVRANNVSLCEVLEQLSDRLNIKLAVNSDDCNVQVSLKFEHYSLDEALRTILRGKNYVLVNNKQHSKLVIVGDNGTEQLERTISKEGILLNNSENSQKPSDEIEDKLNKIWISAGSKEQELNPLTVTNEDTGTPGEKTDLGEKANLSNREEDEVVSNFQLIVNNIPPDLRKHLSTDVIRHILNKKGVDFGKPDNNVTSPNNGEALDQFSHSN